MQRALLCAYSSTLNESSSNLVVYLDGPQFVWFRHLQVRLFGTVPLLAGRFRVYFWSLYSWPTTPCGQIWVESGWKTAKRSLVQPRRLSPRSMIPIPGTIVSTVAKRTPSNHFKLSKIPPPSAPPLHFRFPWTPPMRKLCFPWGRRRVPWCVEVAPQRQSVDGLCGRVFSHLTSWPTCRRSWHVTNKPRELFWLWE